MFFLWYKNRRGRVYPQVRGSTLLPRGDHLCGGGKEHGAAKHEVWDPAGHHRCLVSLLLIVQGAGMDGNVEEAGC